MTASLDARGGGEYALLGEVTFGTAGPLLEAGLRAFAADAAVTVDLGGVTRVDSAGLALLLEWLRAARAAGRVTRFTGLPDKLVAIARLAGVDELLAGA